MWTPVNNYATLEDLRKNKIFLRGKTFSGDEVSGLIQRVYPGIGYMVRCIHTNASHLIIGNLSYSVRPSLSAKFPSEVKSDTYVYMNPDMINYWLESGIPTKYALTIYEMDLMELLDPMSEEGLASSVKPYPLLTPEKYVKLIKKMLYPYNYTTNTYLYEDSFYQYFIETGEESGDVSLQLRIKELEDAWHLKRAIANRIDREIHVYLISGCGNYITIYTFDEDHGILYVENTYGSTTSSFTVKMPISKAAKTSPYMQPSDMSFMSSVCPDDDILDMNIQESPYSHYLNKCSKSELIDEKKLIEHSILCESNKLVALLEEENSRTATKAKIMRLSRDEIEEALEASHHEIKNINRKYRGKPIPFNIVEELEGYEEWCTEAYSVLSCLRKQ